MTEFTEVSFVFVTVQSELGLGLLKGDSIRGVFHQNKNLI